MHHLDTGSRRRKKVFRIQDHFRRKYTMKSASELNTIGAPEAFYRLFRALSQRERFTAAR
jgi:hypothetical protein